jgi:glycosyltransferase involved in cell wall biosynthesis
MSGPLVSVLLTTYNRESYLAPAIESILGQTYRDFELVIVDDCSTDRTLDIARAYERGDSRVRVVVNERNLGQFANRNRAAGLARGSLLKYHDSDDLMYPHCLSVMVPMLLSEPRAGFGLSGGSLWSGGPCPMLLTPRMAYQREFLGEGLFFCGPSGALFRAAVFRELGGFVDEGVASDHLFWMRACKTVSVVLLPADLFWYRLHRSQEFQSAKGQREYARVPGLVWRALQAPDCPLTPEEREQAKRNRAYHVARRTLEDVRRGRWAFAWNRLRHSNMGPGDWLRYLRRPRRDAFAGTPLDAAGEFVVPGWARSGRPAAHVEHP